MEAKESIVAINKISSNDSSDKSSEQYAICPLSTEVSRIKITIALKARIRIRGEL